MQNEVKEINNSEENNTRPFIKPSSWLAKIAYINHLVLFNNVLVAVFAEQGSGKTVFAELLKAGLDSSINTHVVTANPFFSQTDFLSELNSLINKAAFDHTEVKNFTLSKLVDQINEEKQHTIIIIDDAQNLPPTFLAEALVELKRQGNEGFFHLCILSDFSLIAAVNTLEAGWVHTLEPGFLTEIEVKSYLLSSLPMLKRLDKTMAEKRLEQFYQLTGGNIARINSLMLNYFCPDPISPAKKKLFSLKKAIYVGSTVLALSAATYLWKDCLYLKKNTESSEPDSPKRTYAQKFGKAEPALISHIPSFQHFALSKASEIPPWYVGVIIQPVQPSPKRVIDIALDDEIDNALVVKDSVLVVPKILPVNLIKNASTKALDLASSRILLAQKILTASGLTSVKLSKVHQVLAKKQNVPKPLLSQKRFPSSQFVKSSKYRYTVQLLAGPNPDNIRLFIKSHRLKAARVQRIKKGKAQWYVLTVGNYHNLSQAKAAIKKLPFNLTQYKPWARLQTQLKAIG